MAMFKVDPVRMSWRFASITSLLGISVLIIFVAFSSLLFPLRGRGVSFCVFLSMTWRFLCPLGGVTSFGEGFDSTKK